MSCSNECASVQYDFLHDLFVKEQLVDKGCPGTLSSHCSGNLSPAHTSRWRLLHNKFANHVMLQLQCRDFAYIFYAKHPPRDDEVERRRKADRRHRKDSKNLGQKV